MCFAGGMIHTHRAFAFAGDLTESREKSEYEESDERHASEGFLLSWQCGWWRANERTGVLFAPGLSSAHAWLTSACLGD